MSDNSSKIPLSDEDRKVFRNRLLRAVQRELIIAFDSRKTDENYNLSASQLARVLGIHKSVVSRRLNGSSNMTLEVLSDMARAMDFKPVVKLVPYEAIETSNHKHSRGGDTAPNDLQSEDFRILSKSTDDTHNNNKQKTILSRDYS
jgi:transcriptional regulator with XRE-family HTH domain